MSVGLLMTGDWQVAFNNLQECEIMLDELLTAAAERKPDAIIHMGDVKDAYSPVDVEVVKFCVRAVRRIKEAGFRFIILLGNHDRISQSHESKNWLDVLEAAGAEVVTTPKVKKVGNAVVGCVPYLALGEEVIRAAKAVQQATQAHRGPKILLFHAEIGGAMLNSAGRLGKGPTPEEMGFENYDACFGGHIHIHQKIAPNAWYVGAPFAQDWGDANGTRGHLWVEIGASVKVEQLCTSIPHWYDIEYLEENGITPEAGAYIRSKVLVTSRRITDQLRDEEERIWKAYGDVRIHVVPELIEDDAFTEAVIKVIKSGTDRDKIEHYVAATILENHRFEPAQAVSYMVSKLAPTKESAQGGRLRFLGVEADNVLVFEHVAMRLAKLGLVLIRGENLDWLGRSNGTGKTSLLSLLPIALFGQVPNKKQKADAWAYERNDSQATVRLLLTDDAKRKIEIIRGRRPHLIQLRIDGEDRSSGIRGVARNETQGLIEHVTGYDMQMLMNAVYIDQAVANDFVFGTAGKRMDLIARFQDLERFELALKAVNADLKVLEAASQQFSTSIDYWTTEIDDLEIERKELAVAAVKDSNWAKELRLEKDRLDNLIEQHAAVVGVAAMYEELQREADNFETERRREAKDAENLDRQVHVIRDHIKRARELVKAGKCPTCSQPTTGLGPQLIKPFEEKEAGVADDVKRHREAVDALQDKLDATESKIGKFKTSKVEIEQELAESRRRMVVLEKTANEEAERNRNREEQLAAVQYEMRLKQRYREAGIASRQEMSVDMEMLEYAKKAFHRSGIPLYLSVALCPLLNKASDEYSDIFDDNLKVSFRVEDGEFVVDVINPTGSGTTEGQSAGESAMAGIICAFALREVAPKTNLLIVDEPGTGLDPEGCRQFAKGILKLKERFETILLVTHSPYISSLLSGETVYTVRKKNGRSKLFLSSK